MAEERKRDTRHRITLEDRERITMTGIIDVLSFDEESIIADTQRGMLVLKGNNLHIGKLNLDDGEVSVDGMLECQEYNERGMAKAKDSLFGRLFR